MRGGFRRRSGTVLAVAVVLALAALPGTAGAATVRLEAIDDGLCSKFAMCTTTFVFTAEPGEVNAITVERSADRVQVRDAGAMLQAGSRCQLIDEHSVTCALNASGLSRIAAELGDGDDRAATPTSGTVAGEAGDDTLTVAGAADGGAGDDVLICGGLPSQILSGCTLEGGSGRDQISGGPGADVLSGGPAIDELDGGDGSDVLDLSGHRKRVAVDLDAAVQVASVGGVREPIRASRRSTGARATTR